MARAVRSLTIVAALGAALAGCGAGAASPSAVAPSAAAPVPAPSPSGPASAEPAAPTSTASTTSPAPSATAVRWPRPLGQPQQGRPVWGVYLALGHSTTDAALDQAVQSAAAVGYQAVVGDIACDDGATGALGLNPYDYWSGAALYFATKADAQAFVASWTATVAKPKGVARVNLGCLD